MTKVCSKCGQEKPLDKFYAPRADCKECSKARAKQWYESNRKRRYQKHLDWCESNPERIKELRRAALKRHHALHLDEHRVRQAKRRADKGNRTPVWSNLEAIKEFYISCPDGYHVDHIVPLKGKKVSGLHVLDNLQYLPAEENLRKSNTYE